VNRARQTVVVLILLLVAAIGFRWYWQWREDRFDPLIRLASRRYGVDPALVKAVVWRESWFNPKARGRAGELGLMQIRAAAAGEWAEAEKLGSFSTEHLVDPGTNTLAGTWYLAKLLKRYHDAGQPTPYALADYNAGRGNLLKWNDGAAATNSAVFIGQIGFPGTKAYVKSAMRRYELYKFLSRFGG
jgi:soluble lytic murein transglycosylase